MTLSVQEISDRLEIQELLVEYSYAVETGTVDALDAVFTDDACIDYRSVHGGMGDRATLKRFFGAANPKFAGGQLLVATSKITVDGDQARARSVCHHPTVFKHTDGETQVFFCGLWYHDRLVRTPDGWRIKERVAERCYYHNVPDELAFLEAQHDDNCVCLAAFAAESAS